MISGCEACRWFVGTSFGDGADPVATVHCRGARPVPRGDREGSDFMTVRLVGINHVAIEVGDVDAALVFYGALFDLRLRGRSRDAAFVDIGDQFLALMSPRSQADDGARHVGLVVDDKEAVRRALEAAGVELLPGSRLDFLDPWGNRVEIVQYDQVQYTKPPEILRGMDLELTKSDSALAELRGKGLGA
jgi:lactoylglutathione lyase